MQPHHQKTRSRSSSVLVWECAHGKRFVAGIQHIYILCDTRSGVSRWGKRVTIVYSSLLLCAAVWSNDSICELTWASTGMVDMNAFGAVEHLIRTLHSELDHSHHADCSSLWIILHLDLSICMSNLSHGMPAALEKRFMLWWWTFIWYCILHMLYMLCCPLLQCSSPVALKLEARTTPSFLRSFDKAYFQQRLNFAGIHLLLYRKVLNTVSNHGCASSQCRF